MKTHATRFPARFGLAAFLALLALPAGARAQDATDVQALQQAVQALQAEVAALKARADAAEDDGKTRPARRKPAFETGVRLDNLLIFRNDTDFTRARPFYNEQGQTSGAFATVFTPTLQWNATEHIRVFYEAEIGLNYWSKNNPDQENALADDIFVLKHRQIFAEGTLANGRFGFKAGYQYFTDTTGLFLGHWIGAASVSGSWRDGQSAGVFVGMVPDLTYEGLSILENNFRHDIFVFGARTDLALSPHWDLDIGVHALYDASIVGRTRWLVAPNVHVAGRSDWLDGGRVRVHGALDAVVQAGVARNTATDGSDQTILAWAAQAHVGIDMRVVDLRLNAFALSADDGDLGNGRDGAFLYSSKSNSATVFMTEDETRNWYDQLDRRMARYQGGFWQHRAGLVVNDLKVTVTALDWFAPSLVIGNSVVLEPDNALGHRNIGFEGDLDLAFRVGDLLTARMMLGGMLPGKAAGALVNAIDPQRARTDPIWWVQAGLCLKF